MPQAGVDEVVVVAGPAVVVVVVVRQVHDPATQSHPGSQASSSSMQLPRSHTWQPMQPVQQSSAAMQVDNPPVRSIEGSRHRNRWHHRCRTDSPSSRAAGEAGVEDAVEQRQLARRYSAGLKQVPSQHCPSQVKSIGRRPLPRLDSTHHRRRWAQLRHRRSIPGRNAGVRIVTALEPTGRSPVPGSQQKSVFAAAGARGRRLTTLGAADFVVVIATVAIGGAESAF